MSYRRTYTYSTGGGGGYSNRWDHLGAFTGSGTRIGETPVQDNKYYETLGIDRNATAAEIKKSYLMAAKQHHPDKGGNADKVFGPV
jgi:hypothetical protein